MNFMRLLIHVITLITAIKDTLSKIGASVVVAVVVVVVVVVVV